MAKHYQLELLMNQVFDNKTNKHTMNGSTYVLHCHHYASLYSQLADDVDMIDAKKLMADVAEDTFHKELEKYFQENNINTINDRINIAEQYYSATGLGKMLVVGAGEISGEVKLSHSHIDEGWIKKWGKREKPVNFITQGFLAGMFSAIFDKPIGTYIVNEISSIVNGAPESKFRILVK